MDSLLEHLMSIQSPSDRKAFAFGYDSVMSGANEENCHFSIFMQKNNTKAWERGAAEAKRVMSEPAQDRRAPEDQP